MKKLLTIATLGAFALALPVTASAKKPAAAAPSAPSAPAAAPAVTDVKKAADKPAAAATQAAKPIPMWSRVDTINAAAKTFTHKNADGKVVTFTVTATTEIKQGETAAKFEDIKVGDSVAGLRLKKGDGQYEVVKITKFGPAPAKEKAASGAKKAAN